MLRPSKHSHPDQTVINLSCHFLMKLKKKRQMKFDDLKNDAKKIIRGGESLFLPTINFLFLLGVIEYRPKVDSFEYTGP